jgi:hypothetical protein
MAYINRSTLTYPATNAFPNGIWEDTRDPVSGVGGDYKNFAVGVIWINFLGARSWIMVDRTATFGTWIQMASQGTGILTITGDSGGAVGADAFDNINLLGTSGEIVVTGNMGTNTQTLSLDTQVPLQFDEDAGSAIPAANILKIVGTGGINTTALEIQLQ